MAIPATQKALRLQSHAGIYAVDSVPIPSLQPGEILVRVEAAALNPSDWKTRFTEYSYVLKEYPAKQGHDVAGTVVQLGEGVTRFVVGDVVLHQGMYSDKLAGFQQYTAVSQDLAAKVPSTTSIAQAATIPLAIMTAMTSFYHPRGEWGGAGLTPFWLEGGRGKYAGESILVIGGSSAVGQYGIQLAKLSGYTTIVTTASPKYTALLKSLGATHVIDRSLSPSTITANILSITTDPFQVVYDAISDTETQNLGYDVVAPGGTLLIVLKNDVDKAKIVADKEIILSFGSVHWDESHRELGVEIYQRITEWFETGLLKTTEAEKLTGGLEAIPDAQEKLRAGLTGARKLVVNPQETA